MIEASLEECVITAINALGLSDVDIAGFWEAAPNGGVKLAEGSSAATIYVVARPLVFEAFARPVADEEITVVLAVPVERDETAAHFHTLAAALFSRVLQWQLSIADVKATFAVDGFAPCGARLSSGDASYDQQRRAWTCSWTVIVRGVVTSNF